ncbi:MAG TPA: hypothetical protein VIK78_11670 [Ruminiclostridium sp.]
MKKIKLLFFVILFATLNFICSPLESIAKSIDSTNNPNKGIESFKRTDEDILNNKKYSYCDPKMLILGNPNIDPKMLIPGNPNIDPKFLTPNIDPKLLFPSTRVIYPKSQLSVQVGNEPIQGFYENGK